VSTAHSGRVLSGPLTFEALCEPLMPGFNVLSGADAHGRVFQKCAEDH